MVGLDCKLLGELTVNSLNDLANAIVQTTKMSFWLDFLVAAGNGVQANRLLLEETIGEAALMKALSANTSK